MFKCEVCKKPIKKGEGEGIIVVGVKHYAHYGSCFSSMKCKLGILHNERYSMWTCYTTLNGITHTVRDIRCGNYKQIREWMKEGKKVERMQEWFKSLTTRQKYNIYLEKRRKIKLHKFIGSDEEFG